MQSDPLQMQTHKLNYILFWLLCQHLLNIFTECILKLIFDIEFYEKEIDFIELFYRFILSCAEPEIFGVKRSYCSILSPVDKLIFSLKSNVYFVWLLV